MGMSLRLWVIGIRGVRMRERRVEKRADDTEHPKTEEYAAQE